MNPDEVFEALAAWTSTGTKTAMATLIRAIGSAPRPIGARLLIAEDGRMAGSVSGGCVESAVVDQAFEAIRTGVSRLLHYGISDENAWNVGLTCGGEIDVFLEPLVEERLRLMLLVADAVTAERPVATATIVSGPEELLGTSLAVLPDRIDGALPLNDQSGVADSLRTAVTEVLSRTDIIDVGSGITVFCDVIAPPPRVWIVGADNVAVHLVRVLLETGFHPIVIDPRSSFANRARFPKVELHVGWPDEVIPGNDLGPRDYVVVLSNDPKIDEPALAVALAGAPAYVGAIGSRHKQRRLRTRLLALGISQARLRDLHAPIGIDLAGNEPAELALSIAAEIVAVRRGGSGRPMREVRPIVDEESALFV